MSKLFRLDLLGILLVLVFWNTYAHAHIQLTYPAPRTLDLKTGPCGKLGSARGFNVTRLTPGQTLKVTWNETIDHPGHYRISFDDAGENAFVDPAGFDDLNSAPSVLLDNIPDQVGVTQYEQAITLPNIECTTCTLQLIQVMTDKPPYGDGNDLYYQCADLILGPPVDGGVGGSPDAGTGDAGVARPDGSSGGGGGRAPDAGRGGSGQGGGGGGGSAGGGGQAGQAGSAKDAGANAADGPYLVGGGCAAVGGTKSAGSRLLICVACLLMMQRRRRTQP